MIKSKGGRSRSHRTREELEKMLQKEMEHLTSEELEAVNIVLKELAAQQSGEPSLLDVLGQVEYKRTPVDIETFVKDPYYLGATCDNTYPKLLEDLIEIFSGDYHEVIFTGSVGFGKCVAADTEVYDLDNGMRRRVSDLGEYSVLSMATDGKLLGKSSKVTYSGIKSCVLLVLRGGRTITLSTDHPVFTARGWVEASKLLESDLVATPRRIPPPATLLKVSDLEVKLVAYLLADGSTVSGPNTFTNETPEIIEEVRSLVLELGDSSRNRNHKNVAPSMVPTKHQHAGKATTFSLTGIMWLVRKYGIDKNAKSKRIPAEFYGLSDRQISLFLSRFWACDGSISVGKIKLFEATLASEGLVDDLRFLLLRLGIRSRKCFSPKNYKDANGLRRWFQAWTLTVSGAEAIGKLASALVSIPGKDVKLATVASWAASTKPNTNVDVVPIGYHQLKAIRAELGLSGSRLTRRFSSPRKQLLSRDRFERLCLEYKYSGTKSWLAKTDLLWEQVDVVKPVGNREVYDLSVEDTHSFVGNGIVLHNTHVAGIGICRVLYELSCMKDPHTSFGLARGSNISILCTSVNETLAMKVVFESIASKIKASPYFEENFPFEDTKKEMRFQNGIWVAARSSNDSSALGLNAIGGLLDEVNFLENPRHGERKLTGVADRAETLYNIIKRRMKSRFERQGKLPGKLFIISSKNTLDDFTAKRIREGKNDPTVFVRDYALWETRSEDQFSKKRFWVLCGNQNLPSKILTDSEYESFKGSVPEDINFVDVPEDFRVDFERDLEGSLRDLAGVASVSIQPFIQRREKIMEAVDKTRTHPFTMSEFDPSKGGTFRWNEMVAPVMERGFSGGPVQVLRPKINPKASRHLHIDPSYRKDATGVCMAHISGWKDVPRRSEDGKEYMERAPLYTVDLILRIVPPIGGELVLSEIRHLVYDLSAHGYVITGVTTDSWSGPDTIQQFNQRGYHSELLSVDTSVEPYEILKTALYENRVSYYEYPPLLHELQQLERKHDGRKVKIDHPIKGSKDVSDSLAATCYALSLQNAVQPLPIVRGLSYSGDAWLEEQQQSYFAGNTASAVNSDLLPPFLTGGSGSNNDGGWGSNNGGGGWSPI